jgi:hypothetical protein
MQVFTNQSVQIRGVVLNQSHQGIPNIQLTVVGLPDHSSGYMVKTNARGEFDLTAKWSKPGHYLVSVSDGKHSTNIQVNTSSNQSPSSISTSQRGTSATQQEYLLLQPINYSSNQIKMVKQTAHNQLITNPYLPLKMGGNSGVYRLMNITGKDHVLTLSYNDISILEANYFDDISNSIKAFENGNKMNLINQTKLRNGIKGEWWKITYANGSIIEFLTLHMNKTWIALFPNPAQPTNKPLVQAIAESLRQISSVG